MSLSREKTELLEQFQSITGTTSEFAQSFLDSSEWNLQQAVELYLGGALGSSGQAAESSSSDEMGIPPLQTSTQVVPLTNDEDLELERIMEEQGVDRDTALAIEMASSAPDAVRAPILQKRARLFDTIEQENSSLDGGLMDDMRGLTMDGAAEAQIRLARQVMSSSGMSPEAAQQPLMFAPPRRMMFTGSFEEARNEGKHKQRWLLVNIQDQSTFQSLVLNRDLWGDATVQSLVEENFVFWQHDMNSMQGQTFINLYNPGSEYPIVCIVDPRTGQRLETLKISKQEDDLRSAFFDQITTFTDRFSMETAKKTSHPPTTSSSSSSSYASARPPTFDPGNSDNDDKELAAAIQASLALNEPATKAESNGPSKAAAKATPAQLPEKSNEPITLVPLEDEPPAGEETTMVQFRLKNGTRLARRFRKSNKVAMLYSFASTKLPEGTKFELVTGEIPSRNLSDLTEVTLLEANVLQTSLNVNQTG